MVENPCITFDSAETTIVGSLHPQIPNCGWKKLTLEQHGLELRGSIYMRSSNPCSMVNCTPLNVLVRISSNTACRPWS